MKIIKTFKNPFLLFLPFLFIYVLYILLIPPYIDSDNIEYFKYAKNLLNGFYSPPQPDIDLDSGPGYPLVLVPLVALGLPLLYIVLFNAVFYYFSAILLFKALKQITEFNIALVFSLFWASYYVAYQTLNDALTEPLTFLLVSMLIFSLINAFKTDSIKESRVSIYFAGLTLGMLVLTKLLFAYVMLLMIAGCVILLLTNWKNINYRKGLYILLIGFITVIPYLFYTYNLTGKLMFWGTGYSNLYWMSTPYVGEYGDWKGDLTQGTIDMGNYNIPGADDTLSAHYKSDFDEISQHKGLERDDAFKRIALKNIKSHPFKYAENIIYNIGRMIFHYPFSYAVQRPKTLLVFPINGIVLTLILFSLIPTVINWRKIIYPVRFMLIFCFLYLGLSSLVSAYVRMFTIIVPVLVVWFAIIINNSVKINFKFNDHPIVPK